MQFGITIPARDEELFIGACLRSLQPFIEAGDLVIVVDAGSRDQTATVARSWGVPMISTTNPARGRAVAEGVLHLLSSGCVLDAVVIAHADMIFSPRARSSLSRILAEFPETPGGCFGHRIDRQGMVFRLVEWGNRLRARWLQCPYGDQAQFFRPDCLGPLGGFPVQDQLEDVELSLRLRRAGPLVYLGEEVSISPRHWQEGILRTTLKNWWILGGYLLRRKRKPIHDGNVAIAP